jgi:hypothetical protein
MQDPNSHNIPTQRPLRAKKKIWYNFDNFEFVYEGGKAISAS